MSAQATTPSSRAATLRTLFGPDKCQHKPPENELIKLAGALSSANDNWPISKLQFCQKACHFRPDFWSTDEDIEMCKMACTLEY